MQDSKSPSPEKTEPDRAGDAAHSITNLSGPVDPTHASAGEAGAAPPSVETAPTALQIRKLGQYELIELLGQGGMGAVYKARHLRLNKVVALKVLPGELMGTSQAVARFEREMKAVGMIDHPNIVRAMDAGDVDGTYYIAMELVDGTDLMKLVRTHGPRSIGEACDIIRQAACGLQAAHEDGLIHRDIKPANLLMGKKGQVKILDLGLARLSTNEQEPHEAITSSGQILGTPDYMAPEQWEDIQSVDARTDLYALGCTLFFLLTGRAPFATDQFKSMIKKMAAHVNAPIPDLKTIRQLGDVPDELNAVYRRLMAKKPDERFASAEELALALEPFVPSKSTSSVSTTSSAPTSIVEPTPATATFHNSAAEEVTLDRFPTVASLKPERPRRWVLAGVVLGVFAVLVLAIALNFNGPDPTTVVSNVSKAVKDDLSPTQPAASGWHGWPADAPKPAIAPFTAEQAKKYQEAWAEYLKVPVEYENSIGMKFRLIPPGEFLMGSTKGEIAAALKDVDPNDKHWQECINSEAPQHKVILTQPIYLGVNEVTQAEYEKVMGSNPSHFAPMGNGNEAVAGLETADHPVETVSWNDAAEFCAKLSNQEKLKPFYFRAGETVTPLDGTGYDLPTEAEWEFACRSGTTTRFWSGDRNEDLRQVAWHVTNADVRPHSVGELKSNPFGLFDVHGNVWEWCRDAWESGYFNQFENRPAINPVGPTTPSPWRMLRSGTFSYGNFAACRSGNRYKQHPDHAYENLGLRVSLTIDAVRQALKVTGPAIPKQPATSEISIPKTQISNPEPPIDFAAERKAAERLLRLGKGTVIFGNKDRQPIGPLKAPLPDEPFCILEVFLQGTDLTDEELRTLVGCQAMRYLNLQGNPKLTAQGLTQLDSQPELRELIVSETSVGDLVFPWLAGSPNLIRLELVNTNVTSAGWETLPKLPRLRMLITHHADSVGQAGLIQIAEKCPELRELHLFGIVSDFAPLARLLRLQFLMAHSEVLEPPALAHLKNLPALEGLSIISPSPTGLKRLPELAPKLVRLHLRDQGNGLDDAAALGVISELPNLRELHLGWNIAVDGAALKRIAALPNLRKLFINNETDTARFRKFTAEDSAAFRKARPDVELLISGQTFPALEDWPGKFDGSASIAEWKLASEAPVPAVGTFSPEVAQQHQVAWAKHLKQPVEIELDVAEVVRLQTEGTKTGTPKNGTLTSSATKAATSQIMKFRLIPPGEAAVNVGTPEQPRFALQRVEQPYYLGTTEVTVGQFKKFVEATGYVTDAERLKIGQNLQFQTDPNVTWKTPGYAISDDLPVTVVSPADAQAFCAWLNEASRLAAPGRPSSDDAAKYDAKESKDRTAEGGHPTAILYRLPTELEWSVATRAGGDGDFGFAGSAQGVLDYAWTKENVEGKPTPVQPVATKRANPFGLYDILGNVWEWLAGENGAARGILGSSYQEDATEKRVDHRLLVTQFIYPNVGFRVLRQLEPSAPPKFAEQPVLVPRHTPLGPQANVTRPTPSGRGKGTGPLLTD